MGTSTKNSPMSPSSLNFTQLSPTWYIFKNLTINITLTSQKCLTTNQLMRLIWHKCIFAILSIFLSHLFLVYRSFKSFTVLLNNSSILWKASVTISKVNIRYYFQTKKTTSIKAKRSKSDRQNRKRKQLIHQINWINFTTWLSTIW